MIETIAKSDIFFVIASLSTIVVTIVFLIIGYHVIHITKNARAISKTLKGTVSKLDGGLEEMTKHIHESNLFSFFFGKKKTRK